MQIQTQCCRFDEGLNPLFGDRADEEIQYESEIEKILVKGKNPDRVIGLRITNRLDRILNETEGVAGEPVGDLIRTNPFKPGCKPLLFPFLVLEAKSEKSPDTFSKIDLQSGFAIRHLLQLQLGLRNATIANRQLGTQPLVWYLSNRGEVWRVSGAYVEVRGSTNDSEPNYVSCLFLYLGQEVDHFQRVLQLWEGNITYESQALRLLLIIDYIFDWARDVYRKDIIES
jgi:hypothetical protein